MPPAQGRARSPTPLPSRQPGVRLCLGGRQPYPRLFVSRGHVLIWNRSGWGQGSTCPSPARCPGVPSREGLAGSVPGIANPGLAPGKTEVDGGGGRGAGIPIPTGGAVWLPGTACGQLGTRRSHDRPWAQLTSFLLKYFRDPSRSVSTNFRLRNCPLSRPRFQREPSRYPGGREGKGQRVRVDHSQGRRPDPHRHGPAARQETRQPLGREAGCARARWAHGAGARDHPSPARCPLLPPVWAIFTFSSWRHNKHTRKGCGAAPCAGPRAPVDTPVGPPAPGSPEVPTAESSGPQA